MEFSYIYDAIYKLNLAKILNNDFAAICAKYRYKINKIKLKKSSLNRILKIRYFFERDMDWFKRFTSETNWEKEQNKIEKVFDKKQSNNSYDYRILTEGPIIGQQKVKDRQQNIKKDIEQKLSIIEHINDYHRESNNDLNPKNFVNRNVSHDMIK